MGCAVVFQNLPCARRARTSALRPPGTSQLRSRIDPSPASRNLLVSDVTRLYAHLLCLRRGRTLPSPQRLQQSRVMNAAQSRHRNVQRDLVDATRGCPTSTLVFADSNPSSVRRAHPRVLLVAAIIGAAERDVLRSLQDDGGVCLQVEPEVLALHRAAPYAPDLALIAWPEAPLSARIELLYRLRERAACPLILLGCRDEQDELVALEAGFDAVWRDTSSRRLLQSRLRAALRTRVDRVDQRGRRRLLGDLLIDADAGEARFAGRTLDLTRAQVLVLHRLASAPDQPVSRDDLCAAFAQRPTGDNGGRAADALVSRLRARLRAQGVTAIDIVPVRRRGYRLRVRQTAATPGLNPVQETLPPILLSRSHLDSLLSIL